MQTSIRIFKTKSFYRWQRKTFISDKKLAKAISEAQCGLIDAELGGGLIKKRVAGLSFGKSSGYRTIVATNKNDKWFFIFGFAKKDQENLSTDELASLKETAQELFLLEKSILIKMLNEKSLVEIKYEEK